MSPLCSCDWNIYTIRYAEALSKQRGLKRAASEPASDDERSEVSDLMSEPTLEETDMFN